MSNRSTVERVATPAPERVGQGTAIEQSRAAAEVLAAVEVAQRFPRDIQYALTQMRESCKQKQLADRAFYRFPRAGGTVSGASVHLARELARCWGHIQHGLVELRRDDEYGQSEMQAFAWDVQTNTRISSTFIVPHKRDTKDGAKPLAELRDIYENNANNGARRVREAIFAILPPWFVEEAKGICTATLESGGGKALSQRVSEALTAFDENFHVSRAQLETKVGRPTGQWTARDVADLEIVFGSLNRRELTVEDEFPQPRVTTEEITSRPTPAPQPETEEEAAKRAAAEASWGQGGSDE